jgi:hypothetical protein
MLDMDRDTDQVPPGMGKLTYLLLRLKKSGEPISVSINGRGSLPINHDTDFEELLRLVEQIETAEVLKERIEAFRAGEKGVSLEEFKEEVRRTYGISV